MRAIKAYAVAGVGIRVLCLATAAVILLSWWFDVHQRDRINGSVAVCVLLCVLLGVVAGPIRARREYLVMLRWSRRRRRARELPHANEPVISIGTPGLRPDRLVWLVPAALVVPMLAMLPFYFDAHPGDWSVLLDLALLVLLAGYGGLAVGVVVWLVVLLPSLLVVGVLVVRRPEGEGYERLLLAGRAMLGALVAIAVGVTVGKVTR